ncbi:protein phosphatase 2C, putative [Trichomonas vaginalis G3]|uniref:Protein phosphatase 2C, putative n=1 Tax=Trichomonas vaginalis (strain ATCC PRA-98 / G3) TaxID=412133 RepID=A2EBM5_TRIV3|nr:protein serine/threonine phosphatase protein [Trichomonas vaginalis G3]EAY09942.1 protein phosphatase 2C, putative [Trichomonas vaginalis G3]KAI5523083.1 protein serine/threonine phosphatase protein [Trichomonas vaginalis G3]|eukprot:XP_001322165.1 protein phosphatase 2C [Trichomonas vaginalis G3]
MSGEVEILSPEEILTKLQSIASSSSVVMSHIGLITIPQIIVFCRNITTLDLSSNPISSLDPLWNGELINLHKLNLSACWLTGIPYGPPVFSSTLSELYLDGNFLSRNPPNFTIFPHLKKLSIIGNDFIEIPPLPHSLESLVYRMNSLSYIPDCSINYLDASYCSTPNKINFRSKQLSFLDLSHGTLCGDIVLQSLPLLSQLNLSHNSITSITFEGSRRLTEVDISYNALEEIPEALFSLQMLRILKLQHNVISEINPKISSMRRLEYLDLSHNSIFTGKIRLPDRSRQLFISFNIFLAFSSFPLSLETFDASFCQCLVIPASIHKMKSLSLFFVNKIFFSQALLSIKYTSTEEDVPEEEVPERLIPIIAPQVPEKPLLNDSLGSGIGCSATLGRSTKFEDNFMCLKQDNVLFVGVFDGHAGHESALISAECFTKILPSFDFTNAIHQKNPEKDEENIQKFDFPKVENHLSPRRNHFRNVKTQENQIFGSQKIETKNIKNTQKIELKNSEKIELENSKGSENLNTKLIKTYLRMAFAQVNDELRNRKVKDGTTAVVVCLFENRKGAVAHVGDSLALLVGQTTSKLLTKMHRPSDKDEFYRMRKRNKSVSSDWKVDGKLSVSRSLGDFWCCGGMFDDADVSFFDLNDDALSIVLGCDGLWDYVDEGTVCNVVRELRDPVKAAKLLQDIAFASGSHDSISVIVVNVEPTNI